MNRITLYIDFKSPQAYLALKPATELAHRRNAKIAWRPYITRQPRIEPQRADETRAESHVRVRQVQRHETCLRYAQVQDIPMVFPEQPGVTECALAALLWLNAESQAFVEAAFLAYWRDGLDLDDPAVVCELLVASGYNVDGFDPAEQRVLLAAAQEQAEETGVFDTPLFVVEGEMFLGREQLPWIESLLN